VFREPSVLKALRGYRELKVFKAPKVFKEQ
jgi:hypothetical protein